MKVVYPTILKEDKSEKVPFCVMVPDLQIYTQGKDLANAIDMARDAISLMVVTLEDEGKEVPLPNSRNYDLEDGDLVTYVDADPELYRKKLHSKSVKKNCTLPQWIAEAAEAQGINFSRVLQDALLEKIA